MRSNAPLARARRLASRVAIATHRARDGDSVARARGASRGVGARRARAGASGRHSRRRGAAVDRARGTTRARAGRPRPRRDATARERTRRRRVLSRAFEREGGGVAPWSTTAGVRGVLGLGQRAAARERRGASFVEATRHRVRVLLSSFFLYARCRRSTRRFARLTSSTFFHHVNRGLNGRATTTSTIRSFSNPRPWVEEFMRSRHLFTLFSSF